MSKLKIFMGLRGSRRETLSKEYAEKNNYVLISADEIRNEFEKNKYDIQNNIVFEECHRRILENLEKGNDVVFDATNLIKKQRKDLIRKIKSHEVTGLFVLDSYENSLVNNKLLSEEGTFDKNKSLASAITCEIPNLDEGFKDIEFIFDDNDIEKYADQINSLSDKLDPVSLSKIFIQYGKSILNETELTNLKKIGYNNLSAYKAFSVLSQLNYSKNLIELVYNLIIFKKRIRGMNEESKNKLDPEFKELLEAI